MKNFLLAEWGYRSVWLVAILCRVTDGKIIDTNKPAQWMRGMSVCRGETGGRLGYEHGAWMAVVASRDTTLTDLQPR